MFRILLPVDGSACSDRAVRHLVEHSGGYSETPEIHLLHVHSPIPVGRVQQHIDHRTLEEHYREEGEAQLQSAERLLEAGGLAWQRHIHVGSVPEVIVAVARELACDFVFMGTHGRGALPSALLGSVVGRVLHLIDRPVMLAK